MKKKLIIGTILAILSASIIIYGVENNFSWKQALVGFFLFIFPVTFVSSFKSKGAIFFLAFFVILFSYISIRYSFKDVWLGVLLSIVIGSSLFYFRVKNYKTFSPSKFKDELNK